MNTNAEPDAAPAHLPAHAPAKSRARFWGLALGSVGVVYGDIGTSPLYAFREGLTQASHAGVTAAGALGVASLAIWAMILVVTVKYVFFLMRLDNRGEGGVLSLMALAERLTGKRTLLIFILGITGAALFYGDAIITPAISVLSAVEGLKTVPSLAKFATPSGVMVLSLGILFILFAVQSRGTASVARWFGPICMVWFVVLLVLGLIHIVRQPGVLMALSPTAAIGFMINHPWGGLLVLGSVFLTVTGAEALSADMGHFGRKPITVAWLGLVLPCLAINYLGQAAMVMQVVVDAKGGPIAPQDWFFTMAPEQFRAPIVILATLATVIASQAVITGAFSLTNQAIQLGLLPRMTIRQTSEHEAGQIFVPQINALLLVGVVFLVAVFKTSSGLAQAYGLAVTGTMLITTLLAFLVVRRFWNWPLWKAIVLVAPLLVLDSVFLSANALKLLSGGFVPLLLGAALFAVMASWAKGSGLVQARTLKDGMPLDDVIAMLAARPPARVAGTAIFLTADAAVAPTALMHNLKHNRILHERNIILTVRAADTPRVEVSQRLAIEQVSPDFWRVIATWGYMETPDVPRALAACRKQGLKFDIMSTSFFLGRRTVVAATHPLMPRWQQRLYILLSRNAATPADYFQLPIGRVVEMGTQVSV